MIDWIKSFLKRGLGRSKRTEHRIIFVGTDYLCHKLASSLQQRGEAVVAFIDDEPWNHRTLMLGQPIYYPSELKALIEKHKVNTIVAFAECPLRVDPEIVDAFEMKGLRSFIFDTDRLDIEAQISLIVNA